MTRNRIGVLGSLRRVVDWYDFFLKSVGRSSCYSKRRPSDKSTPTLSWIHGEIRDVNDARSNDRARSEGSAHRHVRALFDRAFSFSFFFSLFRVLLVLDTDTR